jgi:hypothetical protein
MVQQLEHETDPHLNIVPSSSVTADLHPCPLLAWCLGIRVTVTFSLLDPFILYHIMSNCIQVTLTQFMYCHPTFEYKICNKNECCTITEAQMASPFGQGIQ